MKLLSLVTILFFYMFLSGCVQKNSKTYSYEGSPYNQEVSDSIKPYKKHEPYNSEYNNRIREAKRKHYSIVDFIFDNI